MALFALHLELSGRRGTPRRGGKGHWETHPGDDLVYVLDGAVTLEIVENDGGWRGVMGAFACRLGIAFLQVHAARVTRRMVDMLRS